MGEGIGENMKDIIDYTEVDIQLNIQQTSKLHAYVLNEVSSTSVEARKINDVLTSCVKLSGLLLENHISLAN